MKRPRYSQDVREFGLVAVLLTLDLGGILAVDAGEAQVRGGDADGLHESLDADVSETVGADDLPDLVDGVLVGDELLPVLHVDSVEAGGDDGRASDADVHLGGRPPSAW